MNAEYNALAWKKAVFSQLIRDLRQKYSSSASSHRQTIYAEDTTYKDREVPEGVIEEVLADLLKAEEQHHRQLEQFEMRKRHVEAPAEVGKPQEPAPAQREEPPPPVAVPVPGAKPGAKAGNR